MERPNALAIRTLVERAWQGAVPSIAITSAAAAKLTAAIIKDQLWDILDQKLESSIKAAIEEAVAARFKEPAEIAKVAIACLICP